MAAPNTLADKVYRPSLAEGKPAFRRATPWATLPITLGIAGVGAGLGMLLARQPGPPATVVRSVRVVLPAWGEVPAPVGRAPVQPIASGRVPGAAPENAPPPAVQPRGELLPHHAPSPVAVAGPGPDDRSGVDRSGVDRSGVDRSGPDGADRTATSTYGGGRDGDTASHLRTKIRPRLMSRRPGLVVPA